jgi:hypothetical protein
MQYIGGKDCYDPCGFVWSFPGSHFHVINSFSFFGGASLSALLSTPLAAAAVPKTFVYYCPEMSQFFFFIEGAFGTVDRLPMPPPLPSL